MPRGWTGVSLPLISTWGSWPTEKFRSLILSEISNIRSIMGGKSKKLIYDRNSARVLVVGGQPARKELRLSNPRQILAHNDDKRKKIMFVTGLERFEETAGQF